MAKAKKRPAKKKIIKKTPTKKKSTKKPASKKSSKKTISKKKTVSKKPIKKAAPKKTTKPQSNKIWEKLIHPLSDRLVVKVKGTSDRTPGGLYIPSTVEDRPNEGEVLACGPGSKSKKGNLKPLDVKVGDRVIFNSHAGVSAQVRRGEISEEVLILREDEILGILA